MNSNAFKSSKSESTTSRKSSGRIPGDDLSSRPDSKCTTGLTVQYYEIQNSIEHNIRDDLGTTSQPSVIADVQPHVPAPPFFFSALEPKVDLLNLSKTLLESGLFVIRFKGGESYRGE